MVGITPGTTGNESRGCRKEVPADPDDVRSRTQRKPVQVDGRLAPDCRFLVANRLCVVNHSSHILPARSAHFHQRGPKRTPSSSMRQTRSIRDAASVRRAGLTRQSRRCPTRRCARRIGPGGAHVNRDRVGLALNPPRHLAGEGATSSPCYRMPTTLWIVVGTPGMEP